MRWGPSALLGTPEQRRGVVNEERQSIRPNRRVRDGPGVFRKLLSGHGPQWMAPKNHPWVNGNGGAFRKMLGLPPIFICDLSSQNVYDLS